MITLDQAKNLQPGQVIYSTLYKNADGSAQRWRVNGKVKTWKTQPGRFCVPLKHGLYDYDYLTELCLKDFALTEEEAM